MHKFLPILNWLPNYKKSHFSGDLAAGITVGIMLVPQGMAYAMLAGLPPIYGLYASIIPLVIYAIFGTSRQLAVGPVAMVSLLVASGVGAMAELGSDSFISLAILLALMVGVIQLIFGILRLGFLVNFLSHPVIAGFTSAAALIIGFSQLKHLFGLDIPRGKVHETIIELFQHIKEVNIPTLIIGAGSIILTLLLKKWNKKIPTPLILVVLGLVSVYFLDLHLFGVAIIKDVPSGLPSIGIPQLDGSSILSLLPIALTISLVSYMESYAVAKAIQSKHKDYKIDPNQELVGLGVANIVGSFFSSFPVTGGFSRTAVNDQAGAKTGVAALISAAVVLMTLMFLTPYFYYLPKAVLAAIIMVAVFGLIDIKEAKHLWYKDKLDFSTFMITAIATLFIGIEPGIAIGVLISLMLVLYKISYPQLVELAQVPNSSSFRNVSRYTDLKRSSNNLIIRFDSQLFFANCNSFKNSILDRVNQNKNIAKVIVQASGIHHVDSSAILVLEELFHELKLQEVQLQFADLKGPVRDIFKINGLVELYGESNFFLSVNDAITNNKRESNYKITNSSLSVI